MAHFLFYGVSRLSQKANKQRLIELLEAPVQALGFELVDLDVRAGNPGLLRIYIDREPAVTLSDCELVSNQLSGLLDVEDPVPGSYVLEVSSPGLDRRLRTLEHFERFAGQEVRIELTAPREGRRRLRGRLVGVEDRQIVVETEQGAWHLQLDEIATARLVPQSVSKDGAGTRT